MVTTFCLNIFSGQVHIISSDRDDSEDEFVAAASPPRMMDLRPNTKELDVSIHVFVWYQCFWTFSIAMFLFCLLLIRSML
jgi:hypothetical protein